MKKRILALMIAVMAVFMTACGGGAAYTPGTFTETGYETEFLGFRFTTPDGFVLATSEELSQIMGVALDAASEAGDVTEIQKKYAELTSIYELMVTDSMGAANANIVLEKTAVPLDTYIEIIKEQFAEMSAMTVTIKGEEEVEFAGATYTKLSADVETSGIAMYQDYYFRKVNGYMMLLTVTWADGFEAEKDAIVNGFAAY